MGSANQSPEKEKRDKARGLTHRCVGDRIELGRNDDLESLGYMLVYFLRGRLPWSGLRAATDEEHRQKILEKKRSIPLETLCENLPRTSQQHTSCALSGLGGAVVCMAT